MKILLDECVPIGITPFLEKEGGEVHHVTTLNLSGMRNGPFYDIAKEKYDFFLTTDRHFRNPKKFPPTPTLTVIYLRVVPPTIETIEKALKNCISQVPLSQLKGKLVILRENSFDIHE